VKAAKQAHEAKLRKEQREASRKDNTGVEGDDVAGTGEEDFEAGMRQNAMERDAADADNDGKLDFGEFCQFVRDREEGEHSEAELRKRFDALDEDKSGRVDMSEYLVWSLRDALLRSSDRVVDLFRAWDEDKSGTVDKKEFFKAIKSLGFEVERTDSDAVFDTLDADRSGMLEYKELNEMLRKGAGSEATKANLKRAGTQRDTGRGAKVTAKNVNQNYVTSRTAALPPMVKLVKGEKSIAEQLRDILAEHSVKLIDLFREWDDDGNGALDKKELRHAIAALGYKAPKKEIDAFFESIDDDENGWIEFAEFKAALTRRPVPTRKL
jgi:Ca2+-binding EF-hand superfamily protein